VQEIPVTADANGHIVVAFKRGTAGDPMVSGLDVVPASAPVVDPNQIAAPPFPVPAPERRTFANIFANKVMDGWANHSTMAVVNLGSTTFVYPGDTAAISVDAAPWGMLDLRRTAFNSTPYDTLSFWINGGPTGGQLLQVQGLLNGSQQHAFALPALAANTWQYVSVPLSSLGVARQPNMDGVQIQNATGATQPTFYVDNWAFTGMAPT